MAAANGDARHDENRRRRRLPDFVQSVNLKYVKLGYHYLITHLVALLLLPLITILLVQAARTSPDDLRHLWSHLQYNLIAVLAFSSLFVFASTVYFLTRPRSVYLVDYACYRPPDRLRAPHLKFMEHSRLSGIFDPSSLDFQRKILERSGLGDDTYFPDAMHHLPPRPSMAAAREEAEQVYISYHLSSSSSYY